MLNVSTFEFLELIYPASGFDVETDTHPLVNDKMLAFNYFNGGTALPFRLRLLWQPELLKLQATYRSATLLKGLQIEDKRLNHQPFNLLSFEMQPDQTVLSLGRTSLRTFKIAITELEVAPIKVSFQPVDADDVTNLIDIFVAKKLFDIHQDGLIPPS